MKVEVRIIAFEIARDGTISQKWILKVIHPEKGEIVGLPLNAKELTKLAAGGVEVELRKEISVGGPSK